MRIIEMVMRLADRDRPLRIKGEDDRVYQIRVMAKRRKKKRKDDGYSWLCRPSSFSFSAQYNLQSLAQIFRLDKKVVMTD